MNFRFFGQIFVFFLLIEPVLALDYVEFERQGKKRSEEGRIILEAQEEGIALESRDGQYYVILKGKIISRRSDDTPFTPYSKKESIERLKKEFPQSEGYYILDKKNFLVVYNTSRAFADWYGNLLEKLYDGYILFWKRKGIELDKPEFQMVAVVLSNKGKFLQYAKNEGIEIVGSQCAYYNKSTHRVAMYDLSGRETAREGDRDRAKSKDIIEFLQQPGSAANVTTVIHEATHQVGFACGMHRRFVPNPIWLCEGLAVLHEVPNLRNRVGWSPGLKLNEYRLVSLRKYLQSQPQNPIETILQEDSVFQVPATASDSYSAAWGLVYFLVEKHPKEFVQYLNLLRDKKVDSNDSPMIRMRDFESCFGDDWDQFYKEFYVFLRKL